MMVKKKQHYLVRALVIIWLSLNNVTFAQVDAPNPQIILRQMIAQYQSVSSYQDTGIVRVLPADTTFIVDSESLRFKSISFIEETLVSFKIYFVRPRKFRFEWKSSVLPASRDAAIWSDGQHAFSWIPNSYPKNGGFTLSGIGDLRFKLNEAQNSSSGAAFIIPSLLMKDVSYLSFAHMVNGMMELSLLREEQFDGETCYVIKGKIDGTPWMLWVGKNSHLLRKTRTLYSSGGSFDEMVEKGKSSGETFMAEEIHRNIKINVQIPGKVFKDRPRLQAQDIDLTR